MIHREHTTITTPAGAPVNVQARLTPQRLLMAAGMALGGVIFGSIGGAMMAAQPAPEMRTDNYQHVWSFFGGGLALFGAVSMLLATVMVVLDIAREYRQQARWDALLLKERQAGNNQTQQTNVKTWEYGPALEPAKVFVAAAWLLLYGPRQPSAIKLSGDALMWRIGGQERQLLRFSSEESAGAFLDLCADAGLIAGRGPRRAGELVPADIETAMERVGRAMLRAERGER